MPELMKLLRTKSMMRYFPPKGTAGLARSLVSGYSRVPFPPASTIPSTRSRIGFKPYPIRSGARGAAGVLLSSPFALPALIISQGGSGHEMKRRLSGIAWVIGGPGMGGAAFNGEIGQRPRAGDRGDF